MQRCTDCLADTPDGSPPKCESCLKEEQVWMASRGGNVSFFFGGRQAPRGTSGVDDDPDAFKRSD